MYHWSVDSSNARNWYTNKWTLVIQLIEPLSNLLEQPFTQAAYTFDYVSNFCHLCLRRIPLTLDFGKYRQNWSRQEINGKRVIQVIRVIVRILYYAGSNGSWSKWLKGTKEIAFLVLRSVRALVSLIQVSKQTDL